MKHMVIEVVADQLVMLGENGETWSESQGKISDGKKAETDLEITDDDIPF